MVRLSNSGIISIIKKYFDEYKHMDSVVDDKEELLFILKLLDEIEEYLSPVKKEYDKLKYYKTKNKYDLISWRQSLCLISIVEASHKTMYANALKYFLDYINEEYRSRSEKNIGLNQYIIYNTIIEIIRSFIKG